MNKPIIDFLSANILANEKLMMNIINSIKIGLLNISNSTIEILFTLKEFIPVMREIDPSGFVLDSCLKETKNYFKQFRNDLNLDLLSFLLHHKSFDFNLKDFEEQKIGNQMKSGFELEYPPQILSEDWKPDPIYVKTFIHPDIRTSDPINLLISHLSASSSSSLSEFFQKQLSERLLKVDSIEEIEQIVEEVEIFRHKCGESFVASLNIMINDIIESRSKTVATSDFKMTIISHRYWPEIVEKDLSHPEFISEQLNSISSTYSRQHEDKKITWRPQLDEVKVSLEFPSGTFLFSCPLEAAILINSFDFPVNPEEEFDLGMAVALTGISDKNILKTAIRFWLKKRVLISSSVTKFHFRFAQEYDANESDCIDHLIVLFDKSEAETFSDEDESLEPDFNIFKEKYWPILTNMFKTFGQISAERIQSTLKMYSKEYKESLEALMKFLQVRVKEGILQSNGNRIILYSLANKH